MSLLRRCAVLLAASVVYSSAAYAQNNNFYLKDGDRVVFYGDSITDQRLYTTFIETYVVTRFPHLDVKFIHSGWGGDRVVGGGGGPVDVRLQRDVITYKPTVMTIMLGMNDGGYQAYNPALFDTYSKGYEHIIDVVKKALPNIRITVIQPSPYDDVTQAPKFEGGYNTVLVRYGNFVKDLAQREGLTVADMNTPVVEDLQKARAAEPAVATKIIPDRVHPSPGGHLIMAEALLKAWNAPAAVSSVEIDATGKQVVHTDNTTVTDLKADGSLSWTQTDNALPMPVDLKDPVQSLAIRSSDFIQALDQEPLKVTGLTAANYTLKIDGKEIGAFTKEQFSEGINLALQPTPMMAQAGAVFGATVQHNNLHYMRWRQLQVPLASDKAPGVQEALNSLISALDAEEAELIQHQHTGALPVPHHYELTAQP